MSESIELNIEDIRKIKTYPGTAYWKLQQNIDTWNVVIANPINEERISHIYPLQQKNVNNLMVFIEDNKELLHDVKSIYIFGSSTTYLCNIWSDLDICFFVENNSVSEVNSRLRGFAESCFKDTDVYFDVVILGKEQRSTEFRLWDNILRGVMIYEQTSS